MTLFPSAFICFYPWSSIVFICFSPFLLIVFVCFSEDFPNRDYVNLACSIIFLWLEGNISSPGRYSYLSVFPDDNADIFAASLLISYYNFSSLILLSSVMIIFYILSET